jgi:histidyl-tRNA synthetase
MRDEGHVALELRTTLQRTLQDLLEVHGYRGIDTPILEPTELFLRKSGGELASRMYTFTDPGGNRVSMRPEFTSSAIRYYLELSESESVSLPLRLQYAGPVFRYDEAQGYKQFQQLGAEIIGAESTTDGELLALALEGLGAIGVVDPKCVIGHVGILRSMLDALGISHRTRDVLISNVQGLKDQSMDSQAILGQVDKLGLVRSIEGAGQGLQAVVNELGEAESMSLLENLFQDSLSSVTGSRSSQEILSRLIRKSQQGDSPDDIEKGIALLKKVVSIENSGEEVLTDIGIVLEEFSLDRSILGPLSDILGDFRSHCPSAELIVDISLVRGISYYTGMVFDLMASGVEKNIMLGGGGRCDGLVKALGGKEQIPTLGFAYNIENLLVTLSDDKEA